MIEVIDKHRGEIESLCRKHGLKRLDLFGSAARGDFDPSRSDFDFFFEFLSDDWKGSADRFFGLQEDLEKLLNAKVELISAKDATNPYFLQVANRNRITLYAA